jgi:GT2 family glycosyltransferase
MSLLVVTPTLGHSPWLEETVASVSNHAPDAVHVLVCPEREVAPLRARFPRLVITAEPSPSRGMYAAINAGVVQPNWDFFTYLNDDDRWEPGIQAATSVAAAPDTTTGVLYGRVRLIRENGAPAGELPVARQPADLRSLLARGIIPFAQPGMLVRRSLLEKLGGFDAGFRSAGDLDLCVRALQAGTRFAFVPRVVAAFRLRTGQLSKDASVVATETARALAPLRRAPISGDRTALLRFRAGNLAVYLDRFRRHGWARMSAVYRKA